MIKQLKTSLNQAGYEFSQHQVNQIDQYCSELVRWNKRINLTSIDEDSMVSLHIIDSLSGIDFLKGNLVLDMGTGGGLPGVPLAIACPDKQFTLLDSRNKKIEFLHHIKSVLGLANILPCHMRMEDHVPDALYDTVITRAFTAMKGIHHLADPVIKPNGRIVAMKGRFPKEELDELERIGVHYEVKSLDVFGLDAQRHVVLIEPGQ